MRGDQSERLGLTHEDLKEANSKLVCVHLSACGRTGSGKRWRKESGVVTPNSLTVAGENDKL